jgi:dipeptidase E
MGETREERILQFHEENAAPVLALREGAMLRVEDGSAELVGIAGGRLFRRGLPPAEVAVGSRLESLWTIGSR